MENTILILNGPNLNMLGAREPEIYGTQTLADIQRACEEHGRSLSYSVDFRQSNHEGELIDWIQQAKTAAGLIINPAGFSHTSVALMDALLGLSIPKLEVHISNIHKRERFRHHSYTAKAVDGVIAGLGANGYILAIRAIHDMPKRQKAV